LKVTTASVADIATVAVKNRTSVFFNGTLISLSFDMRNSWGFQNPQNVLYTPKAAQVAARFELTTNSTTYFFKIFSDPYACRWS
jgi:hypothetical protein